MKFWKILSEKCTSIWVLSNFNEGPGFEKIQVCKMPHESAKIIRDWEGITDNLRQSVILQYSDIGKYLLPLQHWEWTFHIMEMDFWKTIQQFDKKKL